jgi:hypothetical protein
MIDDAASGEPVLKLSRLLELHRELDELFLSHQERLLESELASAAALLDAHSAFFELHAKHEEELLLPVYVRLPFLPRFSVELYTGQHRKMRELLSLARRRLDAIEGNGSARRRQIIALLDLETTYKHLSEHHDGAERAGLFSVLDASADPKLHAELTQRCFDEWGELEKAMQQRWPGVVRAGALASSGSPVHARAHERLGVNGEIAAEGE